jgi:lipid A disaccharide synthetase
MIKSSFTWYLYDGIHALNLVKEIKISILCRIPAEFLKDIIRINAFGFLSLKQIFYLKKVLKKFRNYFIKECPDKAVLVDYYGFHIFARLAKN